MATKKKSTQAKTKKTNVKKTTKVAAVSKAVKPAPKDRIAGLKKWNIILAIVFALQAIVILVIGKAVTVPIVTHYLTNDSLATQAAGHTVLAPAVRLLFDIDVRYLVGAYLLISAVIHILIATLRRQNYEDGLKSRVNHLRWVDYAASSGVMLMLIAMLNGVYDSATLLAVFVLVIILNFLAYFGEAKVPQLRDKMHTFIASCTAGVTVWLIIAIYLKGALFYGVGLSHYVYWVDGIIFVLTVSLAYNTWQVFRAKGKWDDYLFGEKIFMVLSFVAKTALVWLVFAGLLK